MADTILCAATAVETSSATINFWRGSFLKNSASCKGVSGLSVSVRGELGSCRSLPGMRWGREVCIPSSVKRLVELRQRVVGGDGLIDWPVLGCTRFHQIQSDFLQTALLELQHLSRTIGQVNNPACHDRPSVIYFDYYGPSVTQVRHPYVASQGKCRMGCG